MNKQARQKLEVWVQQVGRDACLAPNSWERFLQESAADFPREWNCLAQALRIGVPARLLEKGPVPLADRLTGLTRELAQSRNMAEEAARWSVETWASALGVLSEAERAAIPALHKRPLGATQNEAVDSDWNRPPTSLPDSFMPSPAGALDSAGLEKRTAASLPETAWQTEPPVVPPVPASAPNVPPLPEAGRPIPAGNASFEPTLPPISASAAPPAAPATRSMGLAVVLGGGALLVVIGLSIFFLTHSGTPGEKTSNTVSVSAPAGTGTPDVSPSGASTESASNGSSSGGAEVKAPEDTPPDPGAVEAPPPDETAPGGKIPEGNAAAKMEGLMELVSQRNLTEADLTDRSLEELRLIRNTPYARHGYRFHDARLLSYFEQKSWYHPVSGNADQAWKAMSAVERHNTEFVHGVEKARGGK